VRFRAPMPRARRFFVRRCTVVARRERVDESRLVQARAELAGGFPPFDSFDLTRDMNVAAAPSVKVRQHTCANVRAAPDEKNFAGLAVEDVRTRCFGNIVEGVGGKAGRNCRQPQQVLARAIEHVAAVLVALLLVPSAVAAALHLLPASLLAGKAVRVDHRLFAFLALVATAGMLALAASATLLGRRLSGAQLGSRLYQRAPSNRMGSGPHIVMVCLQMSLMVASGYLSIVAVRSYVLTAQQSLGFDPDKLFSIRLPAVPAQASAPQRLAVWERVASLNGVVAVAAGPLPQGGGRIPVSVTAEAAMSAGDLEASPRNADEQWVDDAWLGTVV